MGKLDAQAHGQPAGFVGATVGCLHDAGAATGDDGIGVLGQLAADLDAQLVARVLGRGACGAEDSDGLRQLG